MSLDASIISNVVRHPENFPKLQRAGVTADYFIDEYRTVWRFLTRVQQSRGALPGRSIVSTRFPDIDWIGTRASDMSVLLDELRKRKKWQEFMDLLDEAANQAGAGPENIDDAIQRLQGRANELAVVSGNGGALIDLFSRETTRKMLREIKRRKYGGALGIPTGLTRIDTLAGGMVKGRMIVVMGRPGLGKSWLDLLFVANAVINGASFILYPLEMTLSETAFRLYTIFSQKMFGVQRVLKNNDLTMGHVTKRQAVSVLHALEDKFAGQLHVADVGSLSDPYTIERVNADVILHKPDGFWVDYITLMKAPEMKKGGDDYSAVRHLSSGGKGIAVREDCIGGFSAQVNREALRVKGFIPRLEHIAYGDSIGQDADQVVSLNRRGQYLYYGMVKNRHGPEISTTRVKFFVDEGVIEETEEQGMEDDE